jgi:hypothetical protein
MTGVLHIAVVMKPLDGNFAQNALKHGVAGLNIDGCRIAGPKGSGVWGTSNKTINTERKFNASPDMTEYRSQQHAAGRWPANVVLCHSDCRKVGTKKVKGNRTDTRPDGDAGRKDRTQWRFRPTDATKRGYADPDGMETVQDWECVDGCPVKALGEQSGITKSGAMKREVPMYEGGSMTGFLRGRSGPSNQHGDFGTAARFFKVFGVYNAFNNP